MSGTFVKFFYLYLQAGAVYYRTMGGSGITAIILAAGLSSRMGRPKALLDLGGIPVLAAQIRMFFDAGVDSVYVVTGACSEMVGPLAAASGASAVYNSRYEEGMFGSVRCGLSEVLNGSASAFFLLPVDVPLVRAAGVKKIIEHYRRSGRSICYPVCGGHRGHPPLISVSLADAVLSYSGDGGLRRLLERYESEAGNVCVDDPGILIDMDDPGAYEEVRRLYALRQLPTKRRCLQILDDFGTPPSVAGHCLKTAETAVELGRMFRKAGGAVSLPVIYSAAVLHDVARTLPRHAAEGAAHLRRLGYFDLADIVADHMDLPGGFDGEITEKHIVYLADKMVSGTVITQLEVRRAAALKDRGRSDDIRNAINRRFDLAVQIRRRLDECSSNRIK